MKHKVSFGHKFTPTQKLYIPSWYKVLQLKQIASKQLGQVLGPFSWSPSAGSTNSEHFGSEPVSESVGPVDTRCKRAHLRVRAVDLLVSGREA